MSITRNGRAGVVAQVYNTCPACIKALSSIPSPEKRKGKERKGGHMIIILYYYILSCLSYKRKISSACFSILGMERRIGNIFLVF